ncbi:MAG: redoxin domain-containing protein [Actinomycetota bacterium]
MSQLGHALSRVEQAGGSMAAIAVTATFSQMEFASATGAGFPLLSDWEGTVASAYGVRYDEWKGHKGVAKRSVFVIDRSGVIAYRWATSDALVLPPLEEALEALEGNEPVGQGSRERPGSGGSGGDGSS